MKKLSSMLALGMALALTFGMTVNATGSKTTEDENYNATQEQLNQASQIIADGKAEVAVIGAPDDCNVEFDNEGVNPETVAEVINNGAVQKALDRMSDAEMQAAIEKLNTVSNKSNVSYEIGLPVAAVEITSNYVPEGGLTLELSSSKIVPNNTTTYVVMHLNSATGLWEVLIPEKIENGKVIVNFKNLSPALVNEVVIVPVGEDKDDDDDDSDQVQASTPAATNPGTSPKTAETLPVAGVMALIALAGAAVCAGKIRYNK